MAPGRSHALATMTAATCFTVAAVTRQDWPGLWMAAGAFTGLLITPDLDIDNGTLAEYLIRERLPLLGKVWWVYWWPYRKLIKHRSFWSHTPPVGTCLRLIYFFWWLYAAGYKLPPLFMVGLVTVDVLHWIMDFRALAGVWKKQKTLIQF